MRLGGLRQNEQRAVTSRKVSRSRRTTINNFSLLQPLLLPKLLLYVLQSFLVTLSTISQSGTAPPRDSPTPRLAISSSPLPLSTPSERASSDTELTSRNRKQWDSQIAKSRSPRKTAPSSSTPSALSFTLLTPTSTALSSLPLSRSLKLQRDKLKQYQKRVRRFFSFFFSPPFLPTPTFEAPHSHLCCADRSRPRP